MATYVPGTLESDPKKIVMSLQQIGPKLDTANTNITNLRTPGTGLVLSGNSLAVSLSSFTASLGADVLLNNIANYFDGPSVAQGTTGTWFVSGSISVIDTAGSAFIDAKLWDGTTVIASGHSEVPAVNGVAVISLSGLISSPAGNLRISAKDLTSASGKILFNATGNSKDSTISAVRIA